MAQVMQRDPDEIAVYESSLLPLFRLPARAEHLQEPPLQMTAPHAANGGIAPVIALYVRPLNRDSSAVHPVLLRTVQVPSAGSFPVPNPPRRAQADEPRTALGRKLRELRTAIVASGVKLLSWDDVEHEIADRRGDSE